MTDSNNLATAHRAWEQRWTDESIRREWFAPETFLMDAMPLLRKRRAQRAIDIGCGTGRHALYLARQGLDVLAIDASLTAVEHTRRKSEMQDLSIDVRQHEFTDLPVADRSIDVAVAWNVIYHGDRHVVQQALDEIRRILVPGGILVCSMISKRHERYGDGIEIRPDTFVVDDDQEKSHPHIYCNDRELIDLLAGFQLLRLQDREQREPGTWHWEFLAELQPAT